MPSNNHTILVLFAFLLLSGCGGEPGLFRSLSPQKSGVDFVNRVEETEELSILDYLYFYNGGGVAIGDIDNDGLPDIYLTANQGPNKLYLNKGGLQFEDITDRAGVGGNSSWNTGVTMADVNGDGYLDIYVCAVVGLLGFEGHNELFINQKDGTFREESASYGLDFDTYSSSAAFFDYDRDGDLDMYLLNHAVHTQESYGKASLRNQRNYSSGDRLLRNDDGIFEDVSAEAGIYGGINGYGLGLCIADFDRDGFTDIFVGNDFHEDDYFYLNQGDGTFRECLREYFGHSSRFSMGNDAADLNGDGFSDLISLDMLPDREQVLKSSEGDDNIQVQRMRTEQYGYHYQFSRNMVFVNQPEGQFLETGLMSGLAATDWSWSALIADYDQDGHNDVYITNGIARRPNDLDFVRYVSNEQVQKKLDNTSLVDRNALELMPGGAVPNQIFQGNGGLTFRNRTQAWLDGKPSLSGAAAKGDLDVDGDLDLVINNFNAPAEILINQADNRGSYLRLSFEGPRANTFGLGTQVMAYAGGKLYYQELFNSRGFQSSCEPLIHLGLGSAQKIDSLNIIWPNGTLERLGETKVNQTIRMKYRPNAVVDAQPYLVRLPQDRPQPPVFFEKDSSALGISFRHREDGYTHFNREPLIPFSVADRGPALLVGDLNGDGLEDVFFGSSKYGAPKGFVRQDSLFVPWEIPHSIRKDSIREWVTGVIADLDDNGFPDIIMGSAGADFFGSSEVLTDNLFRGGPDGAWIEESLPDLFGNTSVILTFDLDADGDLDLFVGQQMLTGAFGLPTDSYVLINRGGSFELGSRISFEGMPTDAVWLEPEANRPGRLVVVGEWMSPRLFEVSEGGELTEIRADLPSGLWETVAPIDWDRDGDLDLALGNWGLNTKFTADRRHPLKMYTADYDQNGSTESVVCTYREGDYYPIYSFDDLSKQLPFLRKKFGQYREFAGRNMNEIFGADAINKAHAWEVTELRSGILINEGGAYSFQAFPDFLQLSPITDFLAFNADEDPGLELLAAGNYFGVKPYQGRFDSFPGALLDPEGGIYPGSQLGLDWQQKSPRELRLLDIKGQAYILVAHNDDRAELYRISQPN